MRWQNQQNECAHSKDSDQPGHPPSLIRVFAVRMKKPWVLSYPLSTQRRLWSDWADAQAYLSLRWVHTHFVGFAMSWLYLCVQLHGSIYKNVKKKKDGERCAKKEKLNSYDPDNCAYLRTREFGQWIEEAFIFCRISLLWKILDLYCDCVFCLL